jgi:hypothetical protein
MVEKKRPGKTRTGNTRIAGEETQAKHQLDFRPHSYGDIMPHRIYRSLEREKGVQMDYSGDAATLLSSILAFPVAAQWKIVVRCSDGQQPSCAISHIYFHMHTNG